MNCKTPERKAADLELRIAKYAPPGKPGQCWLWLGPQSGPGYKDNRGYPSLAINRRKVLMVRFLFERHYGVKIPKGMQVCHSCDNPPCVNPAHWFLGNSQANHDDMARKGRSSATIPVATVLVIKSLRQVGWSYGRIAKLVRVSRSAVAHICKGRVRRVLAGR